ncbi:DUF1493 family protein [Serratia ficaria]|uniref:DUF1493 family protein n=1 Tax=Serratia ficaria TaxID=61651 RepID=UPI0021C6217F|nr:DUF1493 family protein [Serratia ficaria]
MNTEHEILAYVQRKYSHKKFLFFGPLLPVTLETDLRRDLKIIYEDAEELFTYYFDTWKIAPEQFSIDRYFNPEYLGSPKPDKPLESITVRMLIESAKVGRWLY